MGNLGRTSTGVTSRCEASGRAAQVSMASLSARPGGKTATAAAGQADTPGGAPGQCSAPALTALRPSSCKQGVMPSPSCPQCWRGQSSSSRRPGVGGSANGPHGSASRRTTGRRAWGGHPSIAGALSQLWGAPIPGALPTVERTKQFHNYPETLQQGPEGLRPALPRCGHQGRVVPQKRRVQCGPASPVASSSSLHHPRRACRLVRPTGSSAPVTSVQLGFQGRSWCCHRG